MGIVFKNNAKTTLASSLSNSATSATVTDGSVFPSLSAGEFFLITFDDGTNNEICKCTARSGNTLTIVRAQESTTARAFSSGDSAEGRVTAGVLEQIQENIAAKSANQTVFNTTTAGGATTYNIGTNPGVEANAMVFLNGVLQHHDTLSFSGTNLTFDAAPPNGMALEVIIDNLINLQSSNLTVDSFTAADVSGNPQTDFTLSDTPAAETNLIVFVDGVFQDQDAYTISSNTLTITTGVIAGRGVTVYVINPVNIGTPSDSTVTSAKLSGNITMPGNLIVGSNDVAFDSPTFVVDHTNSRVGMGIASPTVPVDIVGDVKMSANLTVDTSTLVVDSTNNRVGIGTASPSYRLHTSGSDAIQAWFQSTHADTCQIQLSTATTNSFARITNNAGTLLYESDITSDNASSGHQFKVDGSERMRIDSSGNVLIGATSSNTGAFGSVSPQLLISGTQPQLILHESDTDKDGYIGIASSIMFIQTADAIPIRFGTSDTERMRIDSSGKVGIGTNSPSHKLDVEGGNNVFDIARFGSSASDNSEITIGYFDANATNGIPGLIEASDFGGLIQGGENGHFVLGIRDNDASDALDIVSGGGNFMSDSTYDTLVATFKASGNVGIGTNPAFRFHAYHPTTNVVGRFESGDNQVWIDLHDDGSGNYGALLGHDSDANVLFQVADASVNTKLIIKDTGELGIGTSPATHYTGYEALDIGNVLSLFSNNTGTNVSTLTNNGYLNSSASQWTYKVTDEATMYSQVHGDHRFSTAASGSAGAAITWSEKMRITSAGNVGIGTTSPSEGVHLGGITNGYMALSGNLSGYSANQYPALKTDGATIHFDANGTYTGYISYNTGFTDISDEREKDNIETITEATSLVKQLRGVTHKWKDKRDEKTHYGLIAQEVEKIVPDVVSEGATKEGETEPTKGVAYQKLVPLLIETIKELEARIKTLEDA